MNLLIKLGVGLLIPSTIFLNSCNTPKKTNFVYTRPTIKVFKNSDQKNFFYHFLSNFNNKQPKNIEEIAEYTNDFVKYKPDTDIKNPKFSQEIWQSAKTTLKRGKGDCDDIAILGAYFLEKLGYPPKILYLTNNDPNKNTNNFGHFIALIEKQENNIKFYGALEKHAVIYPKQRTIKGVIEMENVYYGLLGRKKFNNYFIINLEESKFDWRTGKENLYPKLFLEASLKDDNFWKKIK